MTSKRASDQVYKGIRQRILIGEWQPGMKIMSETQMVREFGVSRVSVREAIEKMVALGMLEKVQGGGTFVRELDCAGFMNGLLPLLMLDRDNYREVLEFRGIIEPPSARLCAERADSALLDALEVTFETMCRHEADKDVFTEADTQFHLLVAQGSGNPVVHKVFEVLRPVLQHHQQRVYTRLKGAGGIEDHKKIITALASRDGELSTLLSRRHIERTINDMDHARHDEDVILSPMDASPAADHED